MEAIDPLTIVNILMTCGIVVTMIAIRQIGKENKALHESAAATSSPKGLPGVREIL